ncbi:hypothetical protein BX616_002874 [Lobosporangium transversale]|uniref:DUF3844 domain-containing protein n=1 Tax=Lobosporangium transversale TaxID=64571 RepID=A0A1Y2GBB5_9FUNG|nr:hypothetical protein BCR41DRAFT_425278 [Lobosporangium transversale]KAF9916760.1 hypothetical protein BX616_002874 [Lobosporangium transversale]ORZ06170.1 hypothetical protein BCR41DRAFT_425278 [Lobosporangium transversale]|eukprot:XP_021877439.1 hypothetical protein BCR41DRAFT_425278 [Lobosporangium transversale]
MIMRFISYMVVALLAVSTHHIQLVEAGSYSLTAPTGATRWVPGQQGLVSIESTEKAKSATPTNDRLLTITLRYYKNIFQPAELVATIKDHTQLLIPFNSTATQVKLDIIDFVVPTTVNPGSDYFVRLSRNDGFFDRENVDTDRFQILAPSTPGTTSPGVPGTTTTAATTTVAVTTTLVVTTPTAGPSPTLPAGQTCNDIKEQCAAQGRVYEESTANTPCACGATLVVPTVVGSGSPGSIKANVKSTFQSTGGPTAALAVLLLVVMTLF